MTKKLLLLAVLFGLFVVTLGAYTRLTNAGLGCPDWPGCYGRMVLPNAPSEVSKAQLAFPGAPIETTKAWTEMAHRYVAGSLGLCILALALWAVKQRFVGIKNRPFRVPLLLVGLVLFQAALGMWTVTLQLLPVVVMGHLLGGMAIVSGLWWCRLSLIDRAHQTNLAVFKPWVLASLCLLTVQIALGGWVSANYAGVACVGFPQCNGQWLPQLSLAKAFNVLAPIGNNYQGGLLDIDARITIQFIHRLGAMVVASFLLLLSWLIIIRANGYAKRLASLMVLLVLTQFTLGVINVVDLLPLPIAVMHNGVALLLLLTMVTLTHHICYTKE